MVPNVDRDTEQLELSYRWWQWEVVRPLWERADTVFSKAHQTFPTQPRNSTPGCLPKRDENTRPHKSCM